MSLRTTLAVALLALLPGPRAQSPWQNPYFGTVQFVERIALGDADGDGQSDVFVHSLAADTLRVLRGHGDGTFEGPFLMVTAGVEAFSVADFDGDGRDDVVVLDENSHLVSVRLAIGAGAYGDPIPVPISGLGASLAAADLDGDGHLDLAVGQQSGSRVSLALGAGDGTFAAAPDASVPPLHESVRTGDVNGDGITDLITWRGPTSGDVLDVELGLGSATFAEPVTVFDGTVDDLDVGDLDGDGTDDLAVLGLGGDLIYGQVGGLPLPAQGLSFGINNQELLRIADVDDDGRSDLLVSGGALIGVSLQLEGGGFGPSSGLICSGTAGAVDLGIDDVDHDGRLDVIAAADGIFAVLIGQGDGGFRPSYGNRESGGMFDVVPADIDLDGRLDLLAGKFGPTGAVLPALPLRRGGFDASFAPPTFVAVGVVPSQLRVSDSTGDGLPDILAIASGIAPDTTARVSITAGAGDLTFGAPVVTTIASVGAAGDFVDFNADGRMDAILVGKTGGGQVRLSMMANQGASFAQDFTTVFTLGSGSLNQLIAADINEDGVTDIVLRLTQPATVQTVLGLVPGGFSAPTAVLSALSLEQIALADVTQDGHLDLVATNRPDDAVLVLTGHGDGSFAAPVTYVADEQPTAFLVGDADEDGRLDVLVRTADGSGFFNMSLFSGQPGGTLALTAVAPLPQSMSAFHLAEIDGDATPDLVMVNGTQIVALLDAHGPWDNLGHSLGGSAGFSKLVGEGSLEPGSPLALGIVHGPPLTPVLLVIGTTTLFAPFKGGTLVPQPLDIKPLGATDAHGELQLATTWPSGPAAGTDFVAQAWFVDASGPAGFASTNAVRGTSP